MSAAESNELNDVLDRVKHWPSERRITLARRVLESVEANPIPRRARSSPLKPLVGLLKTDAPPPTDDECRTILEQELIKKHLK